jgi:CubicO group peptidase (beta-lactamase class C family)
MKRSQCPRLFPSFLLAVVALGVFSFAVQAAPPTGLPKCDPAGVGMDADRLAEIGPRLQQFVDRREISGAVTLVARRGSVVSLEAVGMADVAAGRPMAEDTLFEIASMTKPVTATAVMILQDEGKLSVDDLVSKYIPAFKNASLSGGPPSRELTIRDLVTHTSGLSGNQRCETTLEKTAADLAAQQLGFEPGSRWQYSPGLNVCGRIIEIVSGQPYDAFLEAKIFDPLAMTDTTFRPTAEQQKRLAVLYQPSADKQSLEPAEHWLVSDAGERAPNPSGGLFSTAPNMARFYQMVLSGGELDGRRIVSRAAVARMTSVQTGELTTGFTPGNGWGLGWCIVRQPQGVTRMLSPGTFGHGGAFGTQGWVDPERQMIFVLMIQRTNFGNSDGSDLRDAFQEIAVGAVKE